MDIKSLYKEISNADRELARYSYGYNPETIFEINGSEVSSDATMQIALKHGQALEAVNQLRVALNNAINKVGSLENVVEVHAIRNKVNV